MEIGNYYKMEGIANQYQYTQYLHEKAPMAVAMIEMKKMSAILSTDVCSRSARSKRHGPLIASISPFK